MRRQRLNYARILVIGLGISVAVHVAVIGFGHWNFGAKDVADGSLNLVTLPQPETNPDELDADLARADAALTSSGGFELSELDILSAGPDLAEYRIVLAEATSAELQVPLVPQPRITAASVEATLTPIRVREPALLTLRDRGSDSGRGTSGVGILIGTGGFGPVDNCAPSHINVRFPNQRIPVQFQPQRFGLRPRR
jgi:hypothetical protein